MGASFQATVIVAIITKLLRDSCKYEGLRLGTQKPFRIQTLPIVLVWVNAM
jgi:hypothetical protein